MFVEVEGKGRNAARDHYFLRGPKLCCDFNRGIPNIRSGLGVGCGNGGLHR